ncbi:hypothetical protein OCV51_10225 [Faecalicatena acetigenes]|uniref:Uncharacterized protein n=1 Tax=Faecalicatena acetigenes TaxID=2981790 RepID=A0ABT2TCR3_9FIRM|nr:hypothetical protein [Faecalicatena acetigenes]MCU6748022.1 hypothetical protein [Faecalicatena acetigenes]SCI22092.1 Uncharacterised protein [uncultured Clostridium sp.]
MNEIVKKAMEMMEEAYKDYIPDVNVGEICEMNDIWDGNGDCPQDSYSYQLTDNDWIDYVFEIVEEKENELDTMIKIVNIELI